LKEYKPAAGVAVLAAREVRIQVLRLNFGPGNRSASRIGYRALNDAGRRLGLGKAKGRACEKKN
jgi:hypothetical protein